MKALALLPALLLTGCSHVSRPHPVVAACLLSAAILTAIHLCNRPRS